MDYRAAEQSGNDTLLTGVRHFDPAQTLDCGQAFRWSFVNSAKASESCYTGIAHGRRLNISFAGGNLLLRDVPLSEFESIWKSYFDFGRDYAQLHKYFVEVGNHETMRQALAYSPGLRLMKQDPWEMLISFILSQNSNIPRIKKMISLLCEHFGQPLPCGGFTFPDSEVLASLTPEDLAPIRSGYRAPFIIDSARHAVNGSFNPAALTLLPSEAIRETLLKIHGVGPKVAECILLYGFGRVERYPLDIWMNRVMTKLYPLGFPKGLIEHSGIAQQFLFHYARMNKEQFV